MADTLGSLGGAPARAELAGTEALCLATAYQVSRALHVALRLGLPDLLTGGPQSAEDLARDTGAHAPSLRRLLRVLAAYGVFCEATDGRFALGPLGTALRAGSPGSVRDLALMWGDEDYWITWGELERCVRTGRTAAELLFGAVDGHCQLVGLQGVPIVRQYGSVRHAAIWTHVSCRHTRNASARARRY